VKNPVKFTSTGLIILSIFIYSCNKEEIPTVTTAEITDITVTTAMGGGSVVFDGGAMVSERGVCWSTKINPTINDNKTSDGAGEGSFLSSIDNLDGDTKYYVRAYATNIVGTGYGNEVSFTTNPLITFNPNLTYGSVSDVEGNIYKTIQIGTQIWMAENLKTTKYNDNTAISLVSDNTTWSTLITPAYCWYDNETIYREIYGALYNWYTVNTGKLCLTGWHVPSISEWFTLENFLGGNTMAGGKLKETGTSNWKTPNTGATNESGFTALPSGVRGTDGGFNLIGDHGFWWNTDAIPRGVSHDNIMTETTNSNKLVGCAIRCLKDNYLDK